MFDFDIGKYADRIEESRRRLEVTRRFQEPDRVPINITVGGPFFAHLLGYNIRDYYLDMNLMIEIQVGGVRWRFEELGDDITGFNIYLDLGTAGEAAIFDCDLMYPDDNTPAIVRKYETIEDLERIEILDPETHPRIQEIYRKYEELRERVERTGLNYPVTGGVGMHPPLSALCGIMDVDKVYTYMCVEPERMKKIFAKFVEIFCRVVDYNDKYFGMKRASLGLCDDNSGFISPKMYRERVLPFNKMLYERYGKNRRSLHMDGPADHLFSMISNDLGVDEMDIGGFSHIEAAVEAMKGKTVIQGNVNCKDLYGDFEPARASAEHCLRVAAPGGGYIFGVGGETYAGVNVDTLVDMVDYVKKAGRYPIKPENF